MPVLQNSQNAPVSQQVREQVQQAVQEARAAAQQAAQQAAQSGKVAGPQAPTAPQAPVALPPIPDGGGRIVVDKQGDRTVITYPSVPPEVIPLTGMLQETALGLMGLLAAIFILGPFARVLARRMDRRADLNAGGTNNQVVQQQLLQLQQSVDAMSLEMERISESQRFQSKLLNEGRQPPGNGR